jgi:hypothetical protein
VEDEFFAHAIARDLNHRRRTRRTMTDGIGQHFTEEPAERTTDRLS